MDRGIVSHDRLGRSDFLTKEVLEDLNTKDGVTTRNLNYREMTELGKRVKV